MSRQKGSAKTGGRARGTPNKVTSTLKEFIGSLIDDNREQIKDDLESLQPYQRLAVLGRLMAYVLPKQQSISTEAALDAEYKQLDRLIDTLPDEAINRITEKIVKLQKAKQDEQQGFIETSD